MRFVVVAVVAIALELLAKVHQKLRKGKLIINSQTDDDNYDTTNLSKRCSDVRVCVCLASRFHRALKACQIINDCFALEQFAFLFVQFCVLSFIFFEGSSYYCLYLWVCVCGFIGGKGVI